MKYINPVIKGFYPDPSVCFANGKYYLVASVSGKVQEDLGLYAQGGNTAEFENYSVEYFDEK